MLPFDTFAYAKELRRAGIPEPQVEAQVTALSQAFKHCSEKYPTKEDLHKVELKLNSAINSIVAELKLMKWIGGVCITGIATMLLRSF